MHAHRRRRLQVPLARVVPLQRLIGENAGGADLHQVAAELVLEHAVLVAAEIDVVAQHQGVEIVAAGVVAVESHAAVALDAAVHLVVHEGAQVLVAERALADAVAAIVVAGHHGHVLQMAFAAFVAHRAIVRMVQHQPFRHAGAKLARLGIVNRDASAVLAAVMHAMTILPCLSSSFLNCLTAHWRHAPTEPSAGCQQKYGRSKPSERQPATGSRRRSRDTAGCRYG